VRDGGAGGPYPNIFKELVVLSQNITLLAQYIHLQRLAPKFSPADKARLLANAKDKAP
jgi:hypothetical protein